MSKKKLRNRIKNNHKHHPPKTKGTALRHKEIRELTEGLALRLVDLCPEGRELSKALAKLEEVMMWANAAVARSK